MSRRPKLHPGDNPSKLHLELQSKAEDAWTRILSMIANRAAEDPHLHETSVVLFADLAEPQVLVFLAACGADIPPPEVEVILSIGVVRRDLARAAVSSEELREWLSAPLPPGYVPLLAIAGDGAGDLVCSNIDVRIPDLDE